MSTPSKGELLADGRELSWADAVTATMSRRKRLDRRGNVPQPRCAP